MASQRWKVRSFHFDPQGGEASSSDSDTCASSHASGWEAASSSAPSPNRNRQINRHQRRYHHNSNTTNNLWRGSVRRAGGRVFFGCDSSSSSGAEETMISAFELLYQRRYRVGRSTEVPNPEVASRRPRSNSSSAHSHRVHRNNHYDPNYHHYYQCHRSMRLRNPLQQVPEGDDQSQFSEQISTSSTHDDANHGQSRMMSTFLEQAAENITLHGSVMQARERLDQRFRASSLISDRQNSATSTDAEFQYSFRGDPILSDHWVSEVSWNRLASRNSHFEEDLEVELSFLREPKPQGLNQKGISNLPKEVFEPRLKTGSSDSQDANQAFEQEDCPVCLEHFLPGELLIRLACCHRFHPVCLTPWLKLCGDCPYCRAIVVQDHGPSLSKSSFMEALGI